MPVEEITREEKRVYTMRELEVRIDREYGKGKGKRTIKQWRNHAGKLYEALQNEGIEVSSREQYIIEVVNGFYNLRQKTLGYINSID